jgi:PAS domain-containing protein
MNTAPSLTVRAAVARQRLADLERRGAAATGAESRLLKSALKELDQALEELKTASEQLYSMMDELATTRHDAELRDRQFDELREVLPVPCILMDDVGLIVTANGAASELLNVAQRHLHGKPLMLFVGERDAFFSALTTARQVKETLKTEIVIRPRERKPRPMVAQLSQLEHRAQWCWFFQEPLPQAEVN